MSTEERPTLRWGIVATGLISSWFVGDLLAERSHARANHIITAIGSSSRDKGEAFVKTHLPGKSPKVYDSYEEVYADPDVDIIYIGTPHTFHKQNCLDAIRHGKHVLCEKAFTLTAADARTVFNAAKEKGVFVMEAMWTRFFPLVHKLQKLLHNEKVIGKIHRVFCDFAMDQNIAALGSDSRLKNPALGAGTLLDIGIYSLTWGLLALETPLGQDAGQASERPKILAAQNLLDGVDVGSSIILSYDDGRHGILTSNNLISNRTPPRFCRIEGTEGTIFVEGFVASVPGSLIVSKGGEEKEYKFEKPGKGFFWEADSVALDIAAGRTESAVMPWAETIRVMEFMDEVRRQGGAKFPQDEQ